jgi:hypothetical protein
MAEVHSRGFADIGIQWCELMEKRLDVVVRNAINAGEVPGPRYLANGQEIATTAGELVPGITQIADGVEEMRKVVRETIGLGVDQIKLSISGEEITGTQAATDTYITEEELQVVDEAHRRHVRVCTHARNWLVATINDADVFGYSHEDTEKAGYVHELEVAFKGIQEMRRRGIRVLPGGDYGFAWPPTAPMPAIWSTLSTSSATPRWKPSSPPPPWVGNCPRSRTNSARSCPAFTLT